MYYYYLLLLYLYYFSIVDIIFVLSNSWILSWSILQTLVHHATMHHLSSSLLHCHTSQPHHMIVPACDILLYYIILLCYVIFYCVFVIFLWGILPVRRPLFRNYTPYYFNSVHILTIVIIIFICRTGQDPGVLDCVAAADEATCLSQDFLCSGQSLILHSLEQYCTRSQPKHRSIFFFENSSWQP